MNAFEDSAKKGFKMSLLDKISMIWNKRRMDKIGQNFSLQIFLNSVILILFLYQKVVTFLRKVSNKKIEKVTFMNKI